MTVKNSVSSALNVASATAGIISVSFEAASAAAPRTRAVTSRGPKGEVLGEFEPTGIRPQLMEHMLARGMTLPLEIFAPARRA